MSTSTPMYRLVSGALLRTLMQRTGTGNRVTVRELAAAADVSVGTVGSLLTGEQQRLPEDKAKRIVSVIGVDLLVLFIPCERAGRHAALNAGRLAVAV
ncbi:helix-turn-helix domain-containing protein [Streptomyces sp. NPDC003032]